METTVWSESAIILWVKIAADHDYHLVLADTGGRTMIGEIPNPPCVGSSSPFKSRITSVRHAFDAHYTVTDQWQRINAPVQISGVGFFDFKHGQSGVAPNAIELHPVLSIRFGSAPPGPPPPTSTPTKSPRGTLSVHAYVSPNPVPYGAYATLYGKTTTGAHCSASVLYSTGRPPASFHGTTQTVGASGTVSWSWHMESKGTGGTATVSCTLGRQTTVQHTSFRIAQ